MGHLIRSWSAFASRLPRHSVRFRLTMLYGVLFLGSGVGLLAITYLLVAQQFPRGANVSIHHVATSPPAVVNNATSPNADALGSSPAAVLHQMVIQSGIALGIMAVLSIALGWLIAGRVLRPLRTMTATTRQISDHNLHERLALLGPRDELKDLGDTIDALLTRLEAAFNAQRGFVANASHELRTPLTIGRTTLQVALADPEISLATLRVACEEVLDAGQQQEWLLDALLALASSQQGVEHRETFDLGLIAGAVIQSSRVEATARGLTVDAVIESAHVSGDARLVERIVVNLIDNAIRHNVANGNVRIEVGVLAGHARLRVRNTGPRIPADQIERLLQPFQRLIEGRAGDHEGLGLGLSIVTAIVDAHGAAFSVRPGLAGGLDVEVQFVGAVGCSRRAVDEPLTVPRDLMGTVQDP
jgi:signal transduction histidine kinase